MAVMIWHTFAELIVFVILWVSLKQKCQLSEVISALAYGI